MWVCLGEEENEFVLPANGDHPLKGKLVLVGGAVLFQRNTAMLTPFWWVVEELRQLLVKPFKRGKVCTR